MKSCLPACLSPISSLDLETTHGGDIHHIGAITDGEKRFEHKGGKKKSILLALDRLDPFCQDSKYILGHNLIVS